MTISNNYHNPALIHDTPVAPQIDLECTEIIKHNNNNKTYIGITKNINVKISTHYEFITGIYFRSLFLKTIYKHRKDMTISGVWMCVLTKHFEATFDEVDEMSIHVSCPRSACVT